VVDARHAVGRRRPFEEDELRRALAQGQGLLKGGMALPALQDVVSDPDQIQSLVFFECHYFLAIFVSGKYSQSKDFLQTL
jgi:hypothetical protein